MLRFFPLDGTMTHLRRRRKACPWCSAQARYHHEARASTCANAEVVWLPTLQDFIQRDVPSWLHREDTIVTSLEPFPLQVSCKQPKSGMKQRPKKTKKQQGYQPPSPLTQSLCVWRVSAMHEGGSSQVPIFFSTPQEHQLHVSWSCAHSLEVGHRQSWRTKGHHPSRASYLLCRQMALSYVQSQLAVPRRAFAPVLLACLHWLVPRGHPSLVGKRTWWSTETCDIDPHPDCHKTCLISRVTPDISNKDSQFGSRSLEPKWTVIDIVRLYRNDHCSPKPARPETDICCM